MMRCLRALRAWIGVSTLWVVLGVATGLHAQPPNARVAIVRCAGSGASFDEVATRLGAELRASGFEPVFANASAVDPRDAVEAALGSTSSLAALALMTATTGAAVEVWLSDAVTGKTLVRRVVARPGSEVSNPSMVAVRAVELLRASLIEVEIDRSPRSVAVPPAVHTFLEPSVAKIHGGDEQRHRPWQLGLGAAALWVRSVGFEAGPALHLGWTSAAGWGARLAFVGPVYGLSTEASAGREILREELATLFVTYRIRFRNTGLLFEPWVGVGGHHLAAQGVAVSPYSGGSDQGWAWAADAGAHLFVPFDRRLFFDIGAGARVSLPPIDLRLAGDRVALMHLPSAYCMAGLALVL